MATLAGLPKLIGFFSYSRSDDEADDGAVAALADRIYRELRAQLGRTVDNFKLWRDKDALAAGEHWKEKLTEAVSESVFFIMMVSPSALNSPFCRFEFERFSDREKELGRDDLVFPILYITLPELEGQREDMDPVISTIANRQYVDWRLIRHRDVNSTEVKQTVEAFCRVIVRKLRVPWISPGERRVIEERAENERRVREIEAKRLAEEAERREIGKTQADDKRARNAVEAQHAGAEQRHRGLQFPTTPAMAPESAADKRKATETGRQVEMGVRDDEGARRNADVDLTAEKDTSGVRVFASKILKLWLHALKHRGVAFLILGSIGLFGTWYLAFYLIGWRFDPSLCQGEWVWQQLPPLLQTRGIKPSDRRSWGYSGGPYCTVELLDGRTVRYKVFGTLGHYTVRLVD
jgi:TIR domain